jgi:hypothetical protein
MMNHAPTLDSLIVPASDDLSLMHQHRPDGDAPGRKALERLVNRGL